MLEGTRSLRPHVATAFRNEGGEQTRTRALGGPAPVQCRSRGLVVVTGLTPTAGALAWRAIPARGIVRPGSCAERSFHPRGEARPGYRAHDGYRKLWGRWFDAFEDLRFDPEEILHLGDKFLVTARQWGHGSGSWVAMSERVFQVFTIRRGVSVSQQDFTNRGQARETAGRGRGSGVPGVGNPRKYSLETWRSCGLVRLHSHRCRRIRP
jgi:hypothetical protein